MTPLSFRRAFPASPGTRSLLTICAPLRAALSGSGFLYLKLLGVDVYELAKADAEAEEKDSARPKAPQGLGVAE